MTSIYRKALGPDFDRLHPNIRRRFGLSAEAGIASIGTGVMQRIWHRPICRPLLALGATRHILFPREGTDIPFTVENYAYKDPFGRETVTWIRTFQFPDRTERFDATMIYSERRGGIIDYLGTHQHLAVDLHVEAGAEGGLCIRSGDQRWYERKLGFGLPPALTGSAEVCERFDERADCYRIEVAMTNPVLGPIFGYRGAFQAAFFPLSPDQVPAYAKPLRLELRE